MQTTVENIKKHNSVVKQPQPFHLIDHTADLGVDIARARVVAMHEFTSERLAHLAVFWHRCIRGDLTTTFECIVWRELRRLGDQWAETRVIDGRYGLRKARPSWGSGVFFAIAGCVLLALPFLALGGRPL